MNILKSFLFVIAFFFLFSGKAQNRAVGLTLSGGGARGLAHIGLLKALDEKGIKVDYITGTSMGAIVGGLYAMGYSGVEIEEIAKKENWQDMMSNYISMTDISIEEKDEYQKYIAEFPVKKNGVQLPPSILRGQKLENRLTELTFPVYAVSDFDSLPTPFRCVATDILTGKVVVIKTGSLGTAMRASMGMPTLFRPIRYEGKLLVDGGLIRNFPVEEVLEMGADFVIGSYVGADLYTEEEMQSFDKVILQIGNFSDFYDVWEQKKRCDVLIEPEVKVYATTNFEQIDSLIKAGYVAAMNVLDTLLFEKREKVVQMPVSIKKIRVDSVVYEGLNTVDVKLVKGKMRIASGDVVSLEDIRNGTDRIFGTRNFEKVTYRMVQNEQYQNILIVEAVEQDRSHLKLGVHYNNEIGIGLIVNTTFRNLIGNRSRTLISLCIAENPRLKMDYIKYVGPKQNMAFRFSNNLDYIEIPLHDDDRKVVSIDRYAFITSGVALQSSFSRTTAITLGMKLETVTIKPNHNYVNLFTSQNFSSLKPYAKYEINTLSRRSVPEKGFYLNAVYLFSFNAQSRFYNNNLQEKLIGSERIKPYSQLIFNTNWIIQLSEKLSLLEEFNLGLSFSDKILYTDNMFLGGMNNTLKNSFSFPGMRLYEEIFSNFATVSTGVQYEIVRNFFFQGKVAAMRYANVIDFFEMYSGDIADYKMGLSIGAAYRSVIGPVYMGYARSNALDFGLFNVSIGYMF